MEKKVYFISGHRDITQEEFDRLYKPAIDEIFKEAIFDILLHDYYSYDYKKYSPHFVIGECEGVDVMAQDYLWSIYKSKDYWWFDADNVTIYHMFDSPRHLCKDEDGTTFKTKGGYKSDVERDTAMTEASDEDIAFVRKGKYKSGTAQNIVRRHEF